MRSRGRAAVFAIAVVLAACGEPAISVEIPERPKGEYVADLAHVLGTRAREVNLRLTELSSEGPDIVALTYETEQAGCGEAYRAAREFVREWDADIALVAVAKPGDFGSTDTDRTRCMGVQPRDERAVSAGLREEIAETIVPPKTSKNDWAGAFLAAAEALAER